jgi:hypothetical protein
MSLPRKAWRAPVLIGTLCIAPFLSSGPPDSEALLAELRSGGCEALPLLATHHPEELTLALMSELARHEEPLVRELVAHQDWIPHVNLHDQLAVAATLEPASTRTRALTWITYRTTSRDVLTREAIASYWQTRER